MAALILLVIVIAVCVGNSNEQPEETTGNVSVDVITVPSEDTETTGQGADSTSEFSSVPTEDSSSAASQETTRPIGETTWPTETSKVTESTEQPATELPAVPPQQSETVPVTQATKPSDTEPETKPTEQLETQPVTKPAEKPSEAPVTSPTETPAQPSETVAPTTETENEGGGETVKDSYAVIPMHYPESAVKTLSGRMISLGSFCARAAGESSYVGNRHYTGTNVVISPYFTATVDDETLPVYATPVYVATGNYGALHSYASVDVDFGSHERITIVVQVDGSVSVSSVQVYAQDAAAAACTGNTITLEISKHGMYTVVLNDSQDHAITLMVRQYRDEEAEIAAYIKKYGEKNVIVYEAGVHEISHQLLNKNNMVLYLRSGAILLPEHTIDILSDVDASNQAEMGAKEANGIGLNRYPVINAHNKKNIIIAGRGTVDMTQLDWHERRGIVFTMCENVTMDGVIIINPCEWAFITYRCKNVKVTQSAVLGYRTNSDAFAICNSVDVTVSDCFARTGDDMFEVKTLGGEDTAISKDITFSRCQAWGSKARCFGVIGEIEKNVSDILFEDGIVIFRDAIWDNNRIGSLVVLRECGSGSVDGVTFRNMTIHYDRGRAILVGVYSASLTDSKMTNILFENINYYGAMNSQLCLNSGSGNVLQVKLRNVTANGQRLTANNIADYFYWDASGLYTVE